MLYTAIKCPADRACPKCGRITPPLVIKKQVHATLYCSRCGTFIKHANKDEIKHSYIDISELQDNAPVNVHVLYRESEMTMFK